MNIDGIFQSFRTMGIVMQDTKPPIFGRTFLIETWMKELGLVYLEKIELHIGEIQD